MKSDYEIDSGRLIQLVKSQPTLWDRNYHSYKDRDKTKEAWIAISRNLRDEFVEMEELEIMQISQQLKKKWGNIRDQWLKCRRKLEDEKKCGSSSSRTRRYIFLDQLEFLESSYRFRLENQNNLSEDVSRDVEDIPGYEEPAIVYLNSPESDHEIFDEQTRSLKRRLLSEPSPTAPQEPSENRHLMFFKGIIPSLGPFSEEETIDFQLGVLQLIRTIKHRQTTQPNETTYKSLFPYEFVLPCYKQQPNNERIRETQPSQSTSITTQNSEQNLNDDNTNF